MKVLSSLFPTTFICIQVQKFLPTVFYHIVFSHSQDGLEFLRIDRDGVSVYVNNKYLKDGRKYRLDLINNIVKAVSTTILFIIAIYTFVEVKIKEDQSTKELKKLKQEIQVLREQLQQTDNDVCLFRDKVEKIDCTKIQKTDSTK